MGLDFGLMSILYMYVYIDCGYYEDMPRMCMTQISNKPVYHIDLITRVHFPWVLNPTSSISPPPNYARGIVNQDSKEYIKPLVFIH